MLIEQDQDTIDDLRAEDRKRRQYQARLAAHPDPRDPDYPGDDPEESSLATHLTNIAEWLAIAKQANDRGESAKAIRAIDEIHCECSAALGMD